MARTLAAFLGILCLTNLLAGVVGGAFNANIWWIDLRALPAFAAIGLQVLGGAAFLVIAIGRAMPRLATLGVRAILVSMIVIALLNVATFYIALSRGTIRSNFPIPFSLAVFAILLIIAEASFRTVRPWRWRTAMLTGIAAMVGFPLLQMITFGQTDYARPADVIVVFGARTYADGQPSQALADRVREACELYHRGLASTLLVSGGPGDGEIHETEAMRQMAIDLGVPADRILLDPDGVNTAATVRNSPAILHHPAGVRMLAVSHFYHLPRVKLTYEQSGVEVYTVPAPQQRVLSQLPRLMTREVVALWVYYARGLWRSAKS